MAKLNDDALQAAAPILERYRDILFRTRAIHSASFERDLREVWSTGYKTIKDFVLDMSHHGRFQEVAAYYMQHSNAPGPVSEFKLRLAELYGVPSYDHAPDLQAKRDLFWAHAFNDDAK